MSNINKDKLCIEKNKISGITMISLVITIIVLVIFTSIGINVMVGENGIIDNLKNMAGSKEQEISETQQNVTELEKRLENTKVELFGKCYKNAERKLANLTLEEQIAQLFIIENSNSTNYEELEKCKFGGYMYTEDFFTGKNATQIAELIGEYNQRANIPLAIAVNEEGGQVVNVSKNSNLRSTPFEAPSTIYNRDGFNGIENDIQEKSQLLASIGINLNFAPVLDITTNETDYIYERTFKQGIELTSRYVETILEASKGKGITYCLKHFPGYGNYNETQNIEVVDTRTYDSIYKNDIEPFRAGVKAGAEMIMVGNNIVPSIDNENPVSISNNVHKLLREDLGFSGIIITNTINKGNISEQYSLRELILKAILAGNDMICISMNNNIADKVTGENIQYKDIITYVKDAINNKEINREIIEKIAKRVIAWKYYAGILEDRIVVDGTNKDNEWTYDNIIQDTITDERKMYMHQDDSNLYIYIPTQYDEIEKFDISFGIDGIQGNDDGYKYMIYSSEEEPNKYWLADLSSGSIVDLNQAIDDVVVVGSNVELKVALEILEISSIGDITAIKCNLRYDTDKYDIIITPKIVIYDIAFNGENNGEYTQEDIKAQFEFTSTKDSNLKTNGTLYAKADSQYLYVFVETDYTGAKNISMSNLFIEAKNVTYILSGSGSWNARRRKYSCQ